MKILNSNWINSKSRENIELECERCHQPFLRPKNLIQKAIKRQEPLNFCSRECYFISRKSIILTLICAECSQPFLRKLKDRNDGLNFCSSICGNKNGKRGNRNSVEAHQKLSETFSKTRKLKTRICCICSTEFQSKTANQTCSNICAKKLSKINIKTSWTKSRKILQSLKLSAEYVNGRKQSGGTTRWLSFRTLKVQGSFEYRVCLILDRLQLIQHIISWDYSPRRIKYIGADQQEHTYLIDFAIKTLDNKICFLEIKGWIQDKDWLKWDAAIAQGLTFQVWMKNDIQSFEDGKVPDFSFSMIPNKLG